MTTADPTITGSRRSRPPFRDRAHAGAALAARLSAYRGKGDVRVLGLANGGLVTAAAVAGALRLPLDALIVRTLRAPGRPRRAMGAVAEDGDPHVDTAVLWHGGISRAYVEAETIRQRHALIRRQRTLRRGRVLRLPPVATVILVDDGGSADFTVMAAIRALRLRGVRRLVFAVPVAAPRTVDRLRDMVEELVALETPLGFRSAAAFYRRFPGVPDAEARGLLRAEEPPARAGIAAAALDLRGSARRRRGATSPR